MKEYSNIRSDSNYNIDIDLKHLISQNLNELSETHLLDSLGDYHGEQHDKYVYDVDGINTKILSSHITNQTVISKKGTAVLTILTGAIQISNGWVGEIKLSDGTFYKCEEQQGTIAYDSSGNGNHGVLLDNITHSVIRDKSLINYTNETGYSKGIIINESEDVVNTGISITVDKISLYLQTTLSNQIVIAYNDINNPTYRNIIIDEGKVSVNFDGVNKRNTLNVTDNRVYKVIVDYVNKSITVNDNSITEVTNKRISTYNSNILIGGGEDVAGNIFSSTNLVVVYPKFTNGVTDIEYEDSDIAIINRTIAKYNEISNNQLIDSIGDRNGNIQVGRCYNFDGINDKITIATANNSISEVSGIDINGNVITLTLNYVTNIYEISTTVKVYNIKCWNFGYTPTTYEKLSFELENNLFAWFKCDEVYGTTTFDSSGNGNHGTITNATLSTFHATDVNIPYSWHNEVGYSEGSGAYTGSLIPRNESIPTQDVLGNPLQYQGRVKYNLDMVKSSCVAFDGVNDYGNFNSTITLNMTNNFTLSYYVEGLVSDVTKNIALGDSTNNNSFIGFHTPTYLRINTVQGDIIDFTGFGTNTYTSGKFEYVKTGSNIICNIYSITGILLATQTKPINTAHTLTLNRVSGRSSDFRLSGKLYNLYINNNGVETRYPLAEGKGTRSYAKNEPTKYIDWVNITESTFWSTQDVYHNNLTEGFSEGVNLLRYSERFDNNAWVKTTNTLVLANQSVAPDGSNTADLIYPRVTGEFKGAYQTISTSSSTTATFSIWAKSSGHSFLGVVRFSGSGVACRVNLTDGSISGIAAGYTATSEADGDGYWVHVTGTITVGTSYIQVFVSDGGNINIATASGINGIYVWGSQLEIGTIETPYQKTENSPTSGQKLPYMINGTYTNPSGNWHNKAETKLLAPQAPTLLKKFEQPQGTGLVYNKLFYSNVGVPIPFNPYDINGNYLNANSIFSEELIPNQLSNIIVSPLGFSEYEEITEDLKGNNIIIPIVQDELLDVTGEDAQFKGKVALDAKLINSNCIQSTGLSVEGICNFNCNGLQITSKMGTANVTFDTVNNKLIVGEGTLYNLVLSNGYHFPISEGLGNKSYKTDNADIYINWNNITWTTQDEYHYNITKGFSDNGDNIKRPYKINGIFSNPCINGHNKAETAITMEVFRETLGDSSFHYDQLNLNSFVINYNDILPNYNNIVYSTINGISKRNIITFKNLNDVNIYLNFTLNSNTNGFHKNINTVY